MEKLPEAEVVALTRDVPPKGHPVKCSVELLYSQRVTFDPDMGLNPPSTVPLIVELVELDDPPPPRRSRITSKERQELTM